MNGAVHATPAEQRRVGGIHNRLHPLLRNVTGNDGVALGNGLVGFAVQLGNRKMANTNTMFLN